MKLNRYPESIADTTPDNAYLGYSRIAVFPQLLVCGSYCEHNPLRPVTLKRFASYTCQTGSFLSFYLIYSTIVFSVLIGPPSGPDSVASILSPYFFGASLDASHLRASILSLDLATATLPAKPLSLLVSSAISTVWDAMKSAWASRARAYC